MGEMGAAAEAHASEIAARLEDGDAAVRKAAAMALISLGSTDGMELACAELAERLGDSNAMVRQNAMTSLAQMDEAGAAACACKLKDPDANARRNAVETLMKLGLLAMPYAAAIALLFSE